MSNNKNDKTTNEESESRNIYDEIRAEVKAEVIKKQAQMPPKDAASVLAALSGQQANDAVLAALSGQQPITTKGEKQ